MSSADDIRIEQTGPEHFAGVMQLTSRVYPGSPCWTPEQLASHNAVFPEGQIVAVRASDNAVVGIAASLIVWWDDYDIDTSWRDFTAGGTFANHDPVQGRTLYGAEVMVDPDLQGRGVGSRLYAARRKLTRDLGLLRIRAGARLRDYHTVADRMTAEEYVAALVRGEMADRTVSFQLRHDFHVIGVVSNYLRHDPESLGHAAVIEWVNSAVADREGYSTDVWPPNK